VEPRRRSARREAQLAFEALSIEGGLLSPDWLSRVAQLTAGAQTESDYRIPKGLHLRDEIGRYWRIAQAHWNEFAAGLPSPFTPSVGGRSPPESRGEPWALAERFVQGLLKDAFGFDSLAAAAPVVVSERTYPIGFSAMGGRVPVVIAPAGSGLDTPSMAFGDASRRRTAFGLAQEYLNAIESALWGIASDGISLRVLRDNSSLTRPTWIEADLLRIFTEQRYADFAALWLIAHESRFGRPEQPSSDCALETWRNAGSEEGTRAREHLRRGVEEALIALGEGFLAHPENQSLRAALQDGSLCTKDFFNQLLRLVYRLIFVLTVEERSLLHPADANDAAKTLYAQGYSLRRVRNRAVKRSAHDRFSDLWESVKIVFRALVGGEPRLGLPALSGIFAKNQCGTLDGAKLENRALLLAIFKLAWLREDSGLARVNWRDMGPEELGSVYESLLELVPQIAKDGRQFAFAQGGETKGNVRKITGSYYTPDSLVQVLLDSALEPVIADTIAKNPDKSAEALLALSIVDPACGSGHFLLAAARRLAAHIARIYANGTPSAPEYRHALRQVVSRCIYGVDLNPMAVELCKVSLWMEAVEPGLPLTFLDSHIQCGNSLLGTTPELMAKGVPDAAWEPIEGDDKKAASALKKRNKKHADENQKAWSFVTGSIRDESAAISKAVAELDAQPDADAGALGHKESRWGLILESPEYRHQKFVADAWCSAFSWPKQPGALADAAPTNDLWRQIRDAQVHPPGLTAKTVSELAERYRFFHWHLQFPQVFAKGGFDVVLGNPPWEHVELKEEEWFAERRPDIAAAPNAALRKKLIAALQDEAPGLWTQFRAAQRRFDGDTHLMRSSRRFPLCARGRINTYAIFAEHNRSLLGPSGRAGFIVPTGIATDDTTKDFFRSLVETASLAVLFDFENRDGLFPHVARQLKFCLLGLGAAPTADLVFFAYAPTDLLPRDRHVSLTPADFVVLNPNTGTCPTFRSRRDAEINLAMYNRVGVLWREGEKQGNPWGLRFMQGIFNMASDSGLFLERAEMDPQGEYAPLFEAKMLHQFDHRYGDYSDRPEDKEGTDTRSLPEIPLERLLDPGYVPVPRYWVERAEVTTRLQGIWGRDWLFGWRDVSKSYNERTVVSSILPCVAVGHKFPLMMPSAEPVLVAALYANLCSFVLDYAARQKVGGTSLTYFILKQLPVLAPNTYEAIAPWSPRLPLRDWLLARVLELTYTAWDLEPFARDVGYDGPPFRWNPERRFLLRCELDAAFFHLYSLSRDETAYVMETFPIVKKNDEKAHGDYRTKRVILEIYDALAEAERTSKTYQTRLNPPPADPRLAHPARSPAQTKKRSAS
jgi:hypothetical protein